MCHILPPPTHLSLVGQDIRDPGLVKLLAKIGHNLESLTVEAASGSPPEDHQGLGFPRNFFLLISQWCPSLVTLNLRNLPHSILDSSFPTLMRSVMVNACPSLKTLSFYCSSFYCGLDAHFLLDLLDWAPNLNSLYFDVEDDDALEEIFVALEFQGKHRIHQMKSLGFGTSIGSTLYETQIQTLANLELRHLRSLTIGRLGVDVDPRSVIRLFKKLGPSLFSLKVGVVDGCNLAFPRMAHLRELELEKVTTIGPDHATFFKRFPKLVKCGLSGYVKFRMNQ